MKQENLFSINSGEYAKARPTYPMALYAFIKAHITHHHSVWDCATGSGQAAARLADIFETVYATDISQEQIQHAPQKQNIEYSIQPAERTNFLNQQFDCITVAQALHWFDGKQFWQEVDRVLKPGGLFIAWGYSFFNMNPETDFLFEEDIFKPIESYWPPQVKDLWNGFQNLGMPYTEIPAPKLHIDLNWDFYQLQNYLSTWSATKQFVKQYGQDAFLEKFTRLEKLWGKLDQKKSFKMKLFILAGNKPKI